VGVIDWAVVVEQREDVALAPVSTIGLVSIVATIMSVICVAALLSVLVRHTVQPVEELSQLASRIATSGNLSDTLQHEASTLATHHHDTEIGTLAASFDHMVSGLRQAQERLQQWNEELEQRVTERTAELRTVLEVARLSGASLREQDVLNTILEQVERLIEYDSASVMLLDGSGTSLDIVAYADPTGEMEQFARHFSVDLFPLNREVLHRTAPLIISNTAHEPRWSDKGEGTSSWLAAPLLVQDHPIGILALLKREANFYTSDHANLLAALANQVAVMLAHARLYEDSVRRVEQELEEAEQIQRHLFPHTPQVDGLPIAAYYRPARETTGDFYEFLASEDPAQTDLMHNGNNPSERTTLALDPHHLGVILGDVSGKSLPAALLMAMARTALRSAARNTPHDPAAVIDLANATLVGEVPFGSFVATTYALFNRRDLTLDIINAAQPSPMLLRHGVVTLLEGRGNRLPLGIARLAGYEATRVTLQPDDMVVFYTDGVIEAMNSRHELFGFERLSNTIGATGVVTPQQMLESILTDVTVWTGHEPQSDDIALVVLRVV
jgi:serine phosphatase RsbU (regulator of sigma subunit)